MRDKIDRVLEYALAGIMAIMVVNVLWQVASRYLLGDASSFTEELARFLLIWLGLLGSAYATGKRLHLAIDLLPRKVEGKQAVTVNYIIQATVLLFGLIVMFLGGVWLVNMTFSLKQTSAALGVPLGYVYLVMPISGILIAYYSLLNMRELPDYP